VKKVVAPVMSTKGKRLNVSGDLLRKVLPGPLGQFVNLSGKAWGAVVSIADNAAKS